MKKGLILTTTVCAIGLGLAACNQSQGGKGGEPDTKTYTVLIANKEALGTTWTFGEEDSRTAQFTIKDSDNKVVDYYEAIDAGDFVVTSNNTDVITTSGYGVLVAEGAGQATITATYKQKYFDSITITIADERAWRPTFTAPVAGDYLLGLTPSDGITQYATGNVQSTYYLQSGNFDKAAIARVTVEDVEGDFKYSIALVTKKADGTENTPKVIGSAENTGTDGKKHQNIGFVGSNVPGTNPAVPYTKALFKFNAAPSETDNVRPYTLTTMIGEEEFVMGTYSTNKTFSYRSKDQIEYPAYLYVEGDPIHATSVKIDLEEGQNEVTLRPGFSTKLSYTAEPAFVTDNAKWQSNNQAAVTVSANGIVSAVGDAGQSAELTLSLSKKVSAKVTVKIEGEPLEYGTAEKPLTVAQAKAQLDELGKGFYTTKLMYVTGVVGEVEAWSESDQNRIVWLEGAKNVGFELYKLKGEGVKDLQVGQTVVAYGYAELYNTTYELTIANGENPKLLSVVAPEFTGFTVTPSSITLAPEASQEVSVKANEQGSIFPADPVLSWLEPTEIATISGMTVTAVSDGDATLVVTSGTFTQQVPVHVSSSAAATVTVTKTVAQLKTDNSWSNGAEIGKFDLGEVEVTCTGDSGATKYYDSGSNLRIYVTANGGTGSVAFAAKTGYSIVSVKITYSWNKGTGTFPIESEAVDTVNAVSKSYAITNPGTANEQLRITAFEVVYQAA